MNVDLVEKLDTCMYSFSHGLRTPYEGIKRRNLKFWANMADKICLGHTWGLIFGHSVKTVSSPSLVVYAYTSEPVVLWLAL